MGYIEMTVLNSIITFSISKRLLTYKPFDNNNVMYNIYIALYL